jgi:hypothetical protein
LRTFSRRLVVLLAVAAIAISVLAASPASASPSLNPEPDDTWMTNGHVFSVIRHGDYIYVGGKFTKVLRSPTGAFFRATNLARFDATTGVGDPSWTPDVTGADMSKTEVRGLAAAGGKIWVGGTFQAVDGLARRNLAAVSPDTGTVDPTVDALVGSATSSGVRAMVASSTKVYVGGGFLTVDGKNRRNVAALDLTGELDPTWKPKTEGIVRSLAFSSDGATVFVGGGFRTVAGSLDSVFSPRDTVARFDATSGSLHPWAIPAGTVPNGEIAADLAVTGERITVAYLGSNWLRSFHLDQGNNGQQAWVDKLGGDPQTVAMLGADQIVVGGHFSQVNQERRRRIALVNLADGSLDPTWNPEVLCDPTVTDRECAGPWDLLVDENHLYVGGGFYQTGGLTRTNFARFTLSNPAVVGKAPQDGASGVAADTNVEATFSKDMDPATLNTSTFTLTKQGSTTPLEATVVYNTATKKATLDPVADLEAANATYVATVKGGPGGAKDVAGNSLASDVSWSFATSDTAVPETTIGSGPAGTVNNKTATFEFSSSEPNSTFECSLDGAPFEGCTSPKTYSGLADGGHTFDVRAIDAAGNTDPSPERRSWTVDAALPVVQPPLQSLVMSLTLSTVTVPVRLEWSATDDGSGVSQYQLQQSTNGGAYANVSLSTPTTTGRTVSLSPGSTTYQFRVRAMDGAGNWSEWSHGAQFVVDAHQENSSAISYTGSWTLQNLDTAYGGATQYATTNGDSAQFTFTGTNIAWVAPKGPDRGKAEVWIDGAKVSTVDLYSSTEQPRKVVFTRGWAESGAHTIEVRALGTKTSASSGTRVDVDAFVVLVPNATPP